MSFCVPSLLLHGQMGCILALVVVFVVSLKKTNYLPAGGAHLVLGTAIENPTAVWRQMLVVHGVAA